MRNTYHPAVSDLGRVVSGRSEKVIKNVAVLFFLGWAVIYADRTVLYPLHPAIGDQFNLTNTQVSAIASAYFMPYVAMQIPAGLLGDRWGHKRILTAFYLLAGVGLMALGLVSTNYKSLLFWVGLHGLGAGAFFATAYGFTMAEAPNKTRGLIVAIINSGMGLGMAVGLAMAGPVYMYSDSWQFPFVILAILTLTMAVPFVSSLPPMTSQRTRCERVIARDFDLGILPLYVAFSCSIYTFWGSVAWDPSYLFREHDFDLVTAGSSIAIIATVAITTAIAIGKLSDQFGRKRISQVLLS